MMATMSSTARNKPNNQNLTRSRSLGPKPKPVPSSEPDGSVRKTVEKPLPNYLKPTVSSRPDPVKFLRKNKAVEDNQKLLRRRSFDRPLSSSSTSSTHKSFNASSPARPRDRAVVPREKPVTGLRSTSLHGSSRGGLRGSTTVKSPPVASRGPTGVKKSGLSGTSSSKSMKEGSENVPKKSCSPPAPAQEDEEEIVKVEIDVQVSDHINEQQEEDKDQVEEEKEELINEEQTEEQKEPKRSQENNSEDKEVVEKRVDVEEKSKTVVVTPDMKEAENVEETKEEIEAGVKEEESESSKVKEGTAETMKEVVKGTKGSPTVYNDVIASKMQESSSRKNKVLALAGAFQTVIDYETAASR